MKKEEPKKVAEIIKEVAEATDMSKLTVDEIAKTPDKEPEIQTKLTNKELASSMGLIYVEPARKLGAFGKLPEKLKKEHERDWEYVRGIYENIENIGEAAQFWFCKYPGDPDCFWVIPANKPVYVPRMIAKHLEEIQKYHRFDYINRQDAHLVHGDFDSTFKVVDTMYRGKFRPIEAFK